MEPSAMGPREWTEEELMSLPDVDGKYELVEGELIVGPAGFEHEMICSHLISALDRYVRDQGLGRVAGSSLGCWMKSGNLRSPDVSFVTMERIKGLGGAIRRFLEGAPDLAVEILSPSDSLKKTKEKAFEYLENGARLVWIIDPGSKKAHTIDRFESETTLAVNDDLTGEEVVPGFSIALSALFEAFDTSDS